MSRDKNRNFTSLIDTNARIVELWQYAFKRSGSVDAVVTGTKLSTQTGSATTSSGASALVSPPSGTIVQSVYNAGGVDVFLNVDDTATAVAGGFVGKPLRPGESVDIFSGGTIKAITATGSASVAVTAWRAF